MNKELTGMILLSSWPPVSDNRISLYSLDNEEEYLIERNEQEIQLSALQKAVVTVQGFVSVVEDASGHKRLLFTVTAHRLAHA